MYYGSNNLFLLMKDSSPLYHFSVVILCLYVDPDLKIMLLLSQNDKILFFINVAYSGAQVL